jgi:mannose-6-phosphate isomerase
MQLLEFIPIYMPRVWGGRGLETKLGRSLPEHTPIGESWEIVDRPEAQSTVACGPLAGKTIREILERSAAEILGPGSDPSKPFPILVKWLDCQARLSLQVHPPAEIAAALGGEAKTENWYVADTTPGASLIVGLKKNVTREQFETELAASTAENCVHRFPVKVGDSILVESGRLHAIDAGNLILEIQQNSDTTYRVYDWGRVGLDGAPRQLHVAESLKSIDFNDFEPAPLTTMPGEQTLADCGEFRIRKIELQPGDDALELAAGENARLIHIVTGTVKDTASGETLTYGKNYLQPYVTAARLVAESAATVLITDQF